MLFEIAVPKDREDEFKAAIANTHVDYRCVKLIDLVRALDFGTSCEIVTDPLTRHALADAFDAFHNAALGSLFAAQADSHAREAVSAVVEGFNAVAAELRK